MAEKLEKIVAEIRACRACAERPTQKLPLPHAPRPVLRVSETARICVAGQAPGTRVHASGIPFTDPSGDRLRDWMGVTAEEFYDATRVAILPMGFCFPGHDAKGGDLPPRKECAPLWRARVLAALPRIDLLLAVGQYAHAWHLRDLQRDSLTDTVGAWRAILAQTFQPRILPLPHPSWRNNAWIKQNPWFTEELLPKLRDEVRGLLEG